MKMAKNRPAAQSRPKPAPELPKDGPAWDATEWDTAEWGGPAKKED